MDDQVYEYSEKTWKPCMTEGSGNCFFHAAFGVRVDGAHLYEDRHANFRRAYWSAFLKYFQNEDMPSPLADFLERCFVANDKDLERDYEEYVRDVALPDHWVLVEEIPILATIDNIKIVLFMSERAIPEIFEPRSQLLDNFPFRCTSELRTVVMRLRKSHFERLLSYKQQAEEAALEEEVAPAEDFNETIYTPNEWYSKTGSAGIKGGLYQVDLLTVLLLKGLSMAGQWRLSTENPLAGNKFDDAVFEYSQGHVLIQAKHKENEAEKISFESLMQSSYDHPLNIAKYFIAFQEIRNRFDIKQLVICTNAGMKTDERLKAIIQEETVSTENILFFKNAPNVCYTFTENVVPPLKAQVQSHYAKKFFGVKLCISEEDIRCFLSLLRIFTNYLDEENLENVANEAVSQIPLTESLDATQAVQYVKDQVSNWFQQQARSTYLRTYEANAFFCEKYSLNYVDILKQYKLTWEENHLPPSFCQQPKRDKKSGKKNKKRSGKNSNCGEDLQKHNKQVLHVVPQHDHTLSVVKVFQALQKQIQIRRVLFLNPGESSVVQQHIVKAFAVPRYVYLVIASPRTANKGLVQRIMNILEKNSYKKVIVVADADNKFATALKKESLKASLYELKIDVITFDNLSSETAANMRKRTIVFQGNNMSLEELTGLNTLNHIVDGEMLARLSKKDESIVVGDSVKHSDENLKRYYIYRSFNREAQISEEQMLQSEERVVLISDTAGMGKSTVLASLALAVKEAYRHLWVIRVDLNSYSGIFRKYLKQRRQKIDLLELLNSHKATQLQSEFEKRLFRVNAKVVLMMDAMDEVSPSYMNLVVALLDDCKTMDNIAKIFVTTRPHLCQSLEEILEVKAYHLEPFSKSDQEDFLTRYWTQYLKLQEEAQKERCRLYAKVLIKKMSEWIDEKSEETFAGIPLQTRMLAEVFQERTSDEYWEGCKEFLLSHEDNPSLPNRINLIQLYKMFIEKKRYIFVNDKGQANQLSELVLTEKFDECCKIYRVLALQILFHPFECEFFSAYQNRQKNSSTMEEFLFRIGIVHEKDGQLHFIHRTFAEYYAAECLLEELKLANNNERLMKFFLTEVLLRDEYYVIRAFLDSFIDRELQSLPDDTLWAYSLVDCAAVFSISNSRNTLLHTIAGEGNVGFLRFFLSCAYFGIRDSREREIEDRVLVDVTDLYLATPLHDAAARGHLTIVKELLECGATIDLTDADGNTCLHAAAAGGHWDVVDFLLAQGATTSLRNSYGETAAHLAAQAGHLGVVKLLVPPGSLAAINNAIEDSPALHLAAYRGHVEVVEYLVEAGVNINTTNTSGSTALHAAAQERHLNVVEYLVGKGANATVVNERDKSPLYDAIYGGDLQVAVVLLKYVGHLTARESNGTVHEFDVSSLNDDDLMSIIKKMHEYYFKSDHDDDDGDNNVDSSDTDDAADSSNDDGDTVSGNNDDESAKNEDTDSGNNDDGTDKNTDTDSSNNDGETSENDTDSINNDGETDKTEDTDSAKNDSETEENDTDSVKNDGETDEINDRDSNKIEEILVTSKAVDDNDDKIDRR